MKNYYVKQSVFLILFLIKFNINHAQTISNFLPISGCAGNTSVVITGTGFTGATNVSFNGLSALSYMVNSATQITATPAAGSSTGLISVTAGTTFSSGTNFTVLPTALPPTIVTATPSLICNGGSTNLVGTSTAFGTIEWFDALVAGTSFGTSPSGANFSVSPLLTTTYYAETSENLPPGLQTFTYTGTMQTFTVPPGVNNLSIEVWGAQGYSNALGVQGGLGGYAKGDLAVTGGQTLNIFVGGGGAISIIGGFNGGGNAGTTSSCLNANAGGGGGGSDVRIGGLTLNDRVIVAGGGGGAGGDRVISCGRGSGGGGGGGYYGGGGGAGWPSISGGTMPNGGTQSTGGSGGITTSTAGATNGTAGSFGIGGVGGNEVGSAQGGSGTAQAGGFGGGLTGGPGAFVVNWTGQSGAGGSGYLSPLLTTTTLSNGIHIGNGQVVISWPGALSCPSSRVPVTVTVGTPPVITVTPSTVFNCIGGASTTLTGSGSASTYTWDPGAIVGNPVNVSPAFFTTYTVTGLDANGCTGTNTANVIVTNPTGDLANATLANASSTPGLECNNVSQADGTNLGYFDVNCKMIANVIDAVGGNVLGNVNTCVTVDGSVQLVNGQPYLKRWYEITPTSNGPADVILYLTQDDFDDYNAAPAAAGWPPLPTAPLTNYANVRITKNDAGVLSVITPTIMWDAVNNRYALSFPVTGFSQFRVHSVNNANAPLPVTYKMFTARKENTVDVLDWITGSEENNKQFNVERSANGEEFTRIGVVATKAPNGNSQVDINYTFVDEKPMTGHNYYRLAQEDIDGKQTYSETIDLIWGANGSTITMYPNPTTDVLNVDINATMASNITIRVMDMSGRTVKTTEARTEQGVNNVKINLSEVSSGIYNVQLVENGKLIATERVNKK